jgi:hypothetical protein
MKYDDLDKAILKAIKDGKRQFYVINHAVEPLARPHTLRGDSFRVVDRRLQALRKRGLIAFVAKEWVSP